MAEIPFRILLDFRELNFKFYKFVWMSISPRELVTIKDLKEMILKKFSFERTDLLLFLRDGLLPEDENISNILRENDNVRLYYAEPSYVNLNDPRTLNYEGVEESSNDDQVKSPQKRKEYTDITEDNNEQIESSKKRKHSFSNGTYLFKNNSTPENSAFISAVSDDIENVTSIDLHNSENDRRQSCNIKKKLKYSHDVSQNSLLSENEIVLTSDIIPMSEKNQSKINSCKKKKKHKHSKDLSENEIIFHDEIVGMSEINEKKLGFHKKKKKRKHSHGESKMASVSESAVSFQDETIDTAKKLNNSVNDLETRNELSELSESIFQTVIDDSEVLKLAPVSFCASSISTSSGIGHSLKTSQESNQKISSEQNCSKSYVSDSKSVPKTEENNLSGNNCKKRKRKRHRKRKSLLISPQVDVSNDYNLDMTSPQENENLDSLFSSASYQTPEISPKNKTSDNSKSNSFYSKRKANCSETKSFVEPFGSYLTSTSTPFSQTHAVSSASPRKNVISKMPSSSNASEDQSCSVATHLNTILPAIQKKMDENYLSTLSSPNGVTKNKNNATVSNHNFHEKSLSTEINNSDKSTDSFSNIGTKSRFLDPSFSYKGCPPLNSSPVVGTRIAYKILELDASYSPVVSNYKEGIVKAVNSQTDELEIELVEPEVKEGRFGKFENIYKDEMPSCEVIRKVAVSWSSLIDPVQVIY